MAPDPFTTSSVEHLAARLEPVCAELPGRDRAFRHAVFAWAGRWADYASAPGSVI